MNTAARLGTSATPPRLQVLGRAAWLLLAILALALLIAAVPHQLRELQRGTVGLFFKFEGEEAMVTRVSPGSPAALAGISAGDVIAEVNGQPAVRIGEQGERVFRLKEDPSAATVLTLRSPSGSLRKTQIDFSPPGRLPLNLSLEALSLLIVSLDVLYAAIHLLLGGLIVWRSKEGVQHVGFAILAAISLIVIPLRIPPEYNLLTSADPNWAWLGPLLPLGGYFFIPLVLALFPNGRWFPRWIWVYPLVSLGYGVLHSFSIIPGFPGSAGAAFFADTLVTGIGLVAQFIRYRKTSSAQERQQTKWALFGILIGFVGFYLVNFANNEQWFVIATGPVESPVTYGLISSAFPRLAYLPMLAIPLSLSISILRYRLWELDLLIRRTLIYTLLTAALAAVYAGLVISLQSAFRLLTGQNSVIAIVASTLAITMLFNPLRRGMQTFIDRRFYRHKYDANRSLAAFTATLRNEVDLDHIASSLLDTVENTLQPEQTSLWIVKTKE